MKRLLSIFSMTFLMAQLSFGQVCEGKVLWFEGNTKIGVDINADGKTDKIVCASLQQANHLQNHCDLDKPVLVYFNIERDTLLGFKTFTRKDEFDISMPISERLVSRCCWYID